MADAPKIVVNEVDSTGHSKVVNLSNVSAGFGYFKKGEAFVPTLISDPDSFVAEYDACYADNIQDHRTFMSFFRESEGAPIYVNRLIHNQLPIAGAIGNGYAYSIGSENAGLSWMTGGMYAGDISMLILNAADYLSKKMAGPTLNATEVVRVYAKNPGEWGNNIQVAICNETARAAGDPYISGTSNNFNDVFRYPLGSTALNYEFGILVLDAANNILEKHIVSTVQGHKNTYGENNYVEDYLLAKSAYIRAFHNRTLATSVLPYPIYAAYLAGGSSAASCHFMGTSLAPYYINAQTLADDMTIKGIDIMLNPEKYPFDVVLDSAYVAEGNMILNVGTDSTHTANLVINHDMMKANLYALTMAATTTLMSLNETVTILTTAGAFVGYAKCLAKYGYFTAGVPGSTEHFVIVETDSAIAGTDKLKFNAGITTVVVSAIQSLNTYRKSHTVVQAELSVIGGVRKDSWLPFANSVTSDLFSGQLTEASFISKASAYKTAMGITGTSKDASYDGLYFNAISDYIPELDMWAWIPVAGVVAGRFIRNDRTDGQWYAVANMRGDLRTSGTLLFSPNEDTRIQLSNLNINTLYDMNGTATIDNNKTLYTPKSYFGSVDIRRTMLLIRKFSIYESTLLQFSLDLPSRKEKFYNKLDKRLDDLKNGEEAIREYKIIETTTTDDESLDTARWKIGVKPITSIEWVFVDISLDGPNVNYAEVR